MSNSHTRSEQQTSRIGGHILADALAINAVDTVFCVPGESYLPLVDGLYEHRERIQLVVCRQEGGAAFWMNRYFRYPGFHSQLAPTSGCMGYGVPASIAAKIVHRDRVVLSWNGDGCFMMNGQELATAVRYGLNIVFVVVNNSMFGTIRMHQESHFPGRVYGTELVNPDFVALARAYGAHGERVERTEDFAAAFERALGAGKPALIELVLDPEVLTPTQTIAGLRAANL